MAAVMLRPCSARTSRLKNIACFVNNVKFQGARYEHIRFHHIAADVCRNYRRASHRGIISITIARSASTGVLHDNSTTRTSASEGVSTTDILNNSNTADYVPTKYVSSDIKNDNITNPVITSHHTVSADITASHEQTVPHHQNGSVDTINSPSSENAISNSALMNGDATAATIVSEKAPALSPPPPVLDNIPEPPPIPVEVLEVIEKVQLPVSGEPTFASIGLGGWSPVGMVQNCMEFLHIGCNLPWWTSILIGTIVVRIIIFPLVIMAQRNAAKMTNNLPQLQTLQLKMTEARETGNQLEAARLSQELVIFMKEKQLNPFKNMVVPLAQAPLFISFFMGLRGMANVPVESMRTGGMFWFTDLTVQDQYYLMPLITSVTMWITIEVGADTAKLSAGNMQTMKYVLRALPIIILPFTINFPGAILVYWVSTNFISLMQVGFLKIPAVREYFKIEKTVTHNPDSLPVKPKPFVKGLKDSWTNMRITKELEERQRFDELQFQRAGRGPIQKTYKYDPTRQRSTTTGVEGIAAKKRDR